MVTKKIYKPKNDNEFLEQLSFIRFVSGFRYSVVESRWPKMKKAFYDFSVKKLAKANSKDVIRITNADGMIRNRIKINDTLQNAKICAEIAKEHGSVIKWIAKSKKQLKADPLLALSLGESFRRFHGIGEMTSGWLEALHNAKGNHLTYEMPG